MAPPPAKVHLLRLYARILRLHRHKLPLPLRDVGDQYVREEFRSMWKLDDVSKHYGEFASQWEQYAQTLSTDGGEGLSSGDASAEMAAASGGLGEAGVSDDHRRDGLLAPMDKRSSAAESGGRNMRSGDLSEASLKGMTEDQREQLQRLKSEIDNLVK
mmetsp:Transcript_5843/g.15119  ORF Transcript_5843/g.15119 Transcript_5843/m.15119 type:complete len:158 (-) Transcript_5843:111-584(-)|eukprot:CAMPEP_0197495826 /NCGR_PEP_ID=MMETSP1311-20131121/38813_1 /TAXON_ID=464262 /ORGANISM="Genus nov. species nov., Strain RCC856" /LENGTH=157 /DNA_ID=CAMNT_0043041355 /DNA_START=363 /DNA_END=836 /DNA_ORIENTATION=+